MNEISDLIGAVPKDSLIHCKEMVTVNLEKPLIRHRGCHHVISDLQPPGPQEVNVTI